MRSSFNTLVSKNAETWGLYKPLGNGKLVQNNVFELSHRIKHSSKQVVMMYTLEKDFFAADKFKDLRHVSFQTYSKNGCSILWSV